METVLVALYGLASLLVLFIALPVIALFAETSPSMAGRVLGSPVIAEQVKAAFITSLKASLLAVAVLVVIGTPLAYILARYWFPGKRVVEALVDIPFIMPHAVAGIMLLAAYGRNGLLGGLLSSLGLRIQDSFAGVVAVMLFVSTPLYVDTVKTGIASIDPMLEAVARTLGASRARVLATITLPLAARHMVAGSLLAWARALSEVGALIVVAYYPKTLNILIIEYLSVYGLRYAMTVSALFAAFAIAVFVLFRWVTRS